MRGLDPRIHQIKKGVLKEMDCRITPLRGGPAMTPLADRGIQAASFQIPADFVRPIAGASIRLRNSRIICTPEHNALLKRSGAFDGRPVLPGSRAQAPSPSQGGDIMCSGP